MDSDDSLSDEKVVSSDEPSSSAARDSDNSSSDVNNVVTSMLVIFRDTPSSSSGKDSGDISSDVKNVVASYGEPSYSAANDFGDSAANANNVVASSSEPSSSSGKDSGDSSSDTKNFVASSSERSYSAAKDSSDTSSNANTVASSERSYSAAKDSSDTSSNANTVASRGSDSSGRSVDVASGYTCDELIFHALYTITDNHDGKGLDINGIYEYHRGREGLPENFMDLLREELPKLVIEGQIEKVGNLYKIPKGAITPEASNPTESLDTEGSTMPQELPAEDSVMQQEGSTMPQELPTEDSEMQQQELKSKPRDEIQEKLDEALRLVAVAEDWEIQVKEAIALADRSVTLLRESRRYGLLAEEIARRCARGEKLFLR